MNIIIRLFHLYGDNTNSILIFNNIIHFQFVSIIKSNLFNNNGKVFFRYGLPLYLSTMKRIFQVSTHLMKYITSFIFDLVELGLGE
jgi:hypothetical protein